jgi:hypothetical protein
MAMIKKGETQETSRREKIEMDICDIVVKCKQAIGRAIAREAK